jgi:hypothetical protein
MQLQVESMEALRIYLVCAAANDFRQRNITPNWKRM